MVSVPEVTPATTPPDTVAWPLLLLHMPPVAALTSVMNVPVHTVDAPTIAPASGTGLTLMVVVAAAVPQLLLTVYAITALPVPRPDTTPVAETEATAGLADDHTPPGAASVSVMVDPVQTLVGPEMLPAAGSGLTVIVVAADAMPQVLDMV
jgi:hypothetical protein